MLGHQHGLDREDGLSHQRAGSGGGRDGCGGQYVRENHNHDHTSGEMRDRGVGTTGRRHVVVGEEGVEVEHRRARGAQVGALGRRGW